MPKSEMLKKVSLLEYDHNEVGILLSFRSFALANRGGVTVMEQEIIDVRDAILCMPGAHLEKNKMHISINGRSISIWLLDEWKQYYSTMRKMITNYANNNGYNIEKDAPVIRDAFPWISKELWNADLADLLPYKQFVLWRVLANYYPQLPGYWRISLNQTRTLVSYFENEEQLKKALNDFNIEMGALKGDEAVGDISFNATYSGKNIQELCDCLIVDGSIKEP